MKRVALLVLAVAALAAAPLAASAGPQVQAEAYLVENAATGEILASRDADERLPMASLTKLMTVLLALERARLDDVVTVTRAAASTGESSIDLRPGERITVADLVRAALIESANDAAVALAVHVSGSVPRFVELMNRRAARLGLRDTRFANPDGLDAPGHYSSARDVTRLAQLAMRNPFVRAIVRQRTATIAGGRELGTWNDLLGRFPRLIGVKTGHTDRAGWSQVAAARGPGVTIYATILGAPTRSGRNSDLAELLAWGLSRYRVVGLIDASRTYATVHAPYGRPAVRLVAARPLVRVVRVDRPVVERVVAASDVELPVRKGERLGEVRVYAAGRLVGSSPLVAADARARPGAAGRVGWYARRTVHHLWGLIA